GASDQASSSGSIITSSGSRSAETPVLVPLTASLLTYVSCFTSTAPLPAFASFLTTLTSPVGVLLPSCSTFRLLYFPLASTFPSAGNTLVAVNKYPSAPPRPVIRGCVRPGKTCHRRTLAVCTVGANNSVGLSGKSSFGNISGSRGVVRNAVRLTLEYKSARFANGST